MIKVTDIDLKENLTKYLSIALNEEVYITKDGINIAVIVAPPKKDIDYYIEDYEIPEDLEWVNCGEPRGREEW